ncbi:TlpA family protein disulfide reductase [Marinilabilia sp.]
MRFFSFLLVALLLLAACNQSTKQNSDLVKIQGEVSTPGVEKVVFQWLRDQPIRDGNTVYKAPVDSSGLFSIEFPVTGMASAQVSAGNYFYNIALKPGDDLNVFIDKDSITFDGIGASKNNFLTGLEKSGLSNQSFFQKIYTERLRPSEMEVQLDSFMEQRIALLETYTDSNAIDPEFEDYFSLNSQIFGETQIIYYPAIYSRMMRISADSVEKTPDYQRLTQLNNFVSEDKLKSPEFISGLNRLLHQKCAAITRADTTGQSDREQVYNSLVLDSLSGRVQQFVLASRLRDKYHYEDKHDSVLYKAFNRLASDTFAMGVVERSKKKFEDKQALIGADLHEEFVQTLLVDTAGNELTFGEMIDELKGKVVYLDMWSLGCGPCRMAMPYSKKLKEKMKDDAVEFVYITTDGERNGNLWKNVFDLCQTDENQYRFKDGFNSRLHQFMEINWVPCYMIFDKEGKLVNYNADRPSKAVEGDKPCQLEKELRLLASK